MKKIGFFLLCICCCFNTSCINFRISSSSSNNNDITSSANEIDENRMFEIIREKYYYEIAIIENPELMLEDISIYQQYWNHYDTYIAQFIVRGKEIVEETIEVDGLIFVFDSSTVPYVWNKENSYSLEEAYQQKNIGIGSVMSRSTLLTYWFITNGQEEIVTQIKEDYANYLNEKHSTDFRTHYSIHFTEFYGEYNGAYVIGFGHSVWLMGTLVEIEGVSLYFSKTQAAEVWHNGKIYSLEAAYENELLMLEDLLTIKSILDKEFSE